jgi:hypothetical protein
MSIRFKAFLAVVALLAVPAVTWAADVATSCCCPICCR